MSSHSILTFMKLVYEAFLSESLAEIYGFENKFYESLFECNTRTSLFITLFLIAHVPMTCIFLDEQQLLRNM